MVAYILELFNPLGILHLTAACYFLVHGLYTVYMRRASFFFRVYVLTSLMVCVKHLFEAIVLSHLDTSLRVLALHGLVAFVYALPPILMLLLQALTSHASKGAATFLGVVSFAFFLGHLIFPDSLFVIFADGQIYFQFPAHLVFFYFFCGLVFVGFHMNRSMQTDIDQALRGRQKYVILTLILFALYSIRLILHPIYTVASDILALVILFYAASNKYLLTFPELAKKALLWFLASSIPIIPITAINYTLLSGSFELSNTLVLIIIAFGYYLLFFYFLQYRDPSQCLCQAPLL